MECFTVYADEIEGRIDPFYYKLEFREFEKKIHSKKIKFKKIEEISKVICGPFGSSITIKDYKEKGVPLIRISNIEEDHLSKEDIIYLSEEQANKLKSYRVKKGDLIVSQRGTLGLVVQVDESFDGAVISANFIAIKELEDVSPKFLQIILSSELGQTQLLRKTSGQVQTKITTNDIKTIKIPIIEEIKQKKIIDLIKKGYVCKYKKETEAQKVLDSINDYVLGELGIKLPELKDKMTYVVNFDEVRNSRADAYYYQPKFEEVEQAIRKGKFEVKKLKDITDKLLSGQRPKGGVSQISEGIPSLGGEHILSNGTVATTNLKFIPSGFHEKHLKTIIRKKDIIVVKDGATTGKAGIIPEDYPFEEANINEHVFLIRLKHEINPYYVFAIIKSDLGQIQINREITGGTIMGIIRDSTEAIKIPLPPLTVQNKIASEVKNRMKRAEQLQKEAKEDLEESKKEVEKIILGER